MHLAEKYESQTCDNYT